MSNEIPEDPYRIIARERKRWLSGLIVFSEICFLVASSALAIFVA